MTLEPYQKMHLMLALQKDSELAYYFIRIMDENNFRILLDKIAIFTNESRLKIAERQKRGEMYNVFSTLRLSRSEVRLHSAFLAELLDNKGNHGLDASYLTSFLNECITDFDYDAESSSVSVEYYIGLTDETKENGGRIDIFLRDKNNHAIVIENKVDADDQENQLLRYHNFLEKKHQGKYIILYLTKEGYDASIKSTGDTDIKYIRISYRKHILEWLKRCVEISAQHPLIRETICQYITNLKQILNIMDESENEKIVNTIVGDDNFLKAAFAISNNINAAKYKIVQRIKEWQKEIEEEKLVKDSTFCDKFEVNDGGKFSFGIEGWENHYVEFHFGKGNFRGMYYGIVNKNGKQTLGEDELKHIFENIGDSISYDSWWSFRRYPDNTIYSDWNDDTFIDINTTTNFKEFMKEKIVELVKAAEGIKNM